MRKSILAMAAVAGFLALPSLAFAQEGVAAGAVTGGAAESASRPPNTVVIQESAPVSERTCTTDSAGNRVCTEVRR